MDRGRVGVELTTNQLRSGLVFPLGEIVGEIMIRYFSDATLKINERNSIGVFFPNYAEISCTG